jgi:UDP-N-acetylglucosamine--N-acetylmuramyl-(pentapeptide) pyrophosphoryl-undecaprenol N-acetylglucosamine transferase
LPSAASAQGNVECPLFPVKTLDYCHDMDLAYAAADLVLCRGGAVTVAELTAAAVPAIIMPYPYHKDQQQRLNARELADAGGAVILEDAKDPAANAAALEKLLPPLLADANRLTAMRQAASALGKPQAAADICRQVLKRAT